MKAPAALQARWNGLAPREKTLVMAAAAVVGVALFWWVLVAPALSVLRQAPAQHRTLDAQLQHMTRLQAQAQAMKSQPQQNPAESMRQLEQSIRQHLGVSARYAIAADRVTITLTNTPSEAVAQWLTQARVNARTMPSEARLTRGATGGWDGTIVVTLAPAR